MRSVDKFPDMKLHYPIFMAFLYVKWLSIGCERVIGRCHLQASKVRRDDDDRRPVW